MSYLKLKLKAGKEQSLLRFHPWVYSGALESIPRDISEGDTVTVTDHEENILGMGHWHTSSIAVKLFSFELVIPDDTFWNNKIKSAFRLREVTGLMNNENTNTFRLVNGEGDGLPGLIIDLFNDTAVIQIHSKGMLNIREIISESLKSLLNHRLKALSIQWEGGHTSLEYQEGIWKTSGIGKKTIIAKENSICFSIRPDKIQKTSFFPDRRESRALFAQYCSGRSVLDLFCHTGAFSLYALRNQALMVHSVDTSEMAITYCQKNVSTNFPDNPNHQAFVDDAFKFLDRAAGIYDLMVIDPPAFAKHRKVATNALGGYKKLNQKAIEAINPGGLVFTFSSSPVINSTDFRKAVFSAAAKTGRNVRVLHELRQSVDFPVNIYHPEGEYLNGLVLYVE